ncbi:hypothetical protein [Actinomadura oligospora]|uniref:hypothetical protein n=1 Tax=Actinomadura oligospora TaxID=111804 RepID=UPI0004B4CCB7|nr:hypothetical protein [Actinomadura oligospora]
MDFRLDLSGLRFLVADTPEQRKDFESGALKTDAEGRPMFGVRLLVMDGKGSAPIRVGMAGDPGLPQATFVKVVGLTLHVIERRGESVQWWTVDRLEPDPDMPTMIPSPETATPKGSGK